MMATTLPVTETPLKISPTMSLPLDALTQTFAFIGKRGTGKTNGGVVLTEEFIAAGLPVCVIDPVGAWWGLRGAGSGPGLPVVIFGGDRADITIELGQAAAVADFVIEAHRPTILDLSEFDRQSRVDFLADFAERLFWKKASKRDPLHLVVDEADEFAPQNPKGGAIESLAAMESLIRRGRSRGIGMTLITQRPAVLNKNVLTQAEILVVFQLTAPQDRDAIDAWIRSYATTEQIKTFDRDLTKLPQGDAFVWSPVWLELFERVHFRHRRTYDSSATPKVGIKVAPPPRMLASVELEKLREKFAIARTAVVSDDPEVLRNRIAVLELELAGARAKPVEVPVPVAVVPEAAIMAAIRIRERLKMVLDDVKSLEGSMGDARPIEFVTDEKPPLSREVAPAPPPPPTRVHAEPGALGKGERAILTVLELFGPMSKIELAIRTLYNHAGGGFGNYLSSLRAAGCIEGEASRYAITSKGRALKAREPIPTGRALVDAWLAKVGGGAPRKSLEELVSVHPRKLSKDALAHRVGYEPSGGGFGNALSLLRSRALAKGKREIGLSDALAAALVTGRP